MAAGGLAQRRPEEDDRAVRAGAADRRDRLKPEADPAAAIDRGRVLVIGAGGFIGSHAVLALSEAGHEVSGTSRTGAGADLACDLLEPASVEAAVRSTAPDAVLMAAGLSSVKSAWADPSACFSVNTRGVFNLLEALRKQAPETHLVLASSASVYGRPGSPGSTPFTEASPAGPASPYAASKLAAEVLCRQYADQHGLALLILRLFNQIGPGLGAGQAPAEFARRIAIAEREGQRELELTVGNPSARRDFTDVRDSSRAIVEALGRKLTGTFNLCSGRTVKITEIVEDLSQAADVRVGIEVDERRAHPADIDEVGGSAEKLSAATGWRPGTPIRQSLSDLLEDWRERA